MQYNSDNALIVQVRYSCRRMLLYRSAVNEHFTSFISTTSFSYNTHAFTAAHTHTVVYDSSQSTLERQQLLAAQIAHFDERPCTARDLKRTEASRYAAVLVLLDWRQHNG